MTYGDGVSDINIRELVAFHKTAREDRHDQRSPARRKIRRAGPFHRRPCPRLPGEAARRRGLDKRRFLRAGPGGVRLPRRDATVLENEPLAGLARDGQLVATETPWVLAADGHPAGQDPARGSLAVGESPLEGLGMNATLLPLRTGISGAESGCSSPDTPASRDRGSPSGFLRWARRSPATPSTRPPSPASTISPALAA